ncbi:MAG TPA: glycosyltransferase family 2 protein [Acidimicrobiales bacterium]|nr:glycosyltransferase family 2 protein [Acidimicrobiales bacterium]
MSGLEDTPAEPDTAVVIVNFRTPELTLEAACSVASEPEVAEIVVVDNGSGDGSAQTLRSHLADPRAVVVESSTNLGFGRGLNLGVRSSTSPLVLALNSDAMLQRGSLRLLRRTLLADESIGVVAPAVYGAGRSELQGAAHGVFPTLRAILLRTNVNPPETLWPDWVSGVAMLMRRSDFAAVGGFDPDFTMYLEDVDLCRRFRAAGKQVRRELSAAVVHVGGGSWSSSNDQFGQAHRSRTLYFRKAGVSPAERLAVQVIRAAHAVARAVPRRRRTAG